MGAIFNKSPLSTQTWTIIYLCTDLQSRRLDYCVYVYSGNKGPAVGLFNTIITKEVINI